jgi:MFS family permease
LRQVCLLLIGRLGDVLGRRYFLIGGQTIGFIGALVCGRAKNIPTLIGGSVLTGLAAANQLTFTFVIAELVPNKHRPIVNSGLFLSTLPFAAFGPLIAELFVKNTAQGWRWSYYLNAITCGLSALLFLFFYFPPGYAQLQRNTSRWAQVKKLDYVGFVLYSGGLILVMLGLSKSDYTILSFSFPPGPPLSLTKRR